MFEHTAGSELQCPPIQVLLSDTTVLCLRRCTQQQAHTHVVGDAQTIQPASSGCMWLLRFRVDDRVPGTRNHMCHGIVRRTALQSGTFAADTRFFLFFVGRLTRACNSLCRCCLQVAGCCFGGCFELNKPWPVDGFTMAASPGLGNTLPCAAALGTAYGKIPTPPCS